MKKTFVILFILICALSLSLVSCSNNEEKLYLTKQINSTTAGRNSETIYYYDDNYTMVKSETIVNGAVESFTEYTYDENGLLIYQKHISSESSFAEDYFTYNEDGKILSRRAINTHNNIVMDSLTTYEYTDKNGSYIRTGEYSQSTVTCDEKGNKIKEVSSNGYEVVWENKYDGNLLIEVRTTNKLLLETTVGKYEYDKYGNITKLTSYDKIGNISGTIEWVYSDELNYVE